MHSWEKAQTVDLHRYTGQSVSNDLICATVKSRYIGDGHPTFNRSPYNGYINPYYSVDDHPLLYGNNGSLDPGTYDNQFDINLIPMNYVSPLEAPNAKPQNILQPHPACPT